MQTSRISSEILSGSVIAVPPLARNGDLSLNREENRRIAAHLVQGGVTTLLYGGNAVLYHTPLSEYGELLTMLADVAPESALMIPSVGPAYGTMLDQAAILREFPFPTAMVLPQKEVTTSTGIATGFRRFVERFGRPSVLYIKHDAYIAVDAVKRLMEDGVISFIKYAVVCGDPAEDSYLRGLVDAVGPSRLVSGIGEQPALPHLRRFGLAGFTSGCVCIAPALSAAMLEALRQQDYERADTIRALFRPLEDLRNRIHPIRVLHAAVALAGIARTGPILPLLSDVDESDVPAIRNAALELLGHARH
jgi:dihydrodipicolinate synthase/N-acetylneuraminate lyase